MQDEQNLSPLRAFFRQKWVRIILIFDAVLIVGLIIVLIVFSFRNAVINFNITPLDAEISVNGKSGYENGSYSFFPGTYEIVISHESLEPKTFTIDLEPHHNMTLTTFLSDHGNFDYYLLKGNLGSMDKLQQIASASDNQTTDQDTSATNFIANYQKSYQFIEDLPLIDRTPTEYGFEYGASYAYDTLTIQNGIMLDQCTKLLCLYITDTSGTKEQYALSLISQLGYDPNNYQIIYQQVEYEYEDE